MSTIHVKQLRELPEDGYEGNRTPSPAFCLTILIDNNPIPDIRLKTTGFTSVILPPNSVLGLSGRPGNLYWVNGLTCDYNDQLVNSFNKPLEVHIFRLAEPEQPSSSIFPLTS